MNKKIRHIKLQRKYRRLPFGELKMVPSLMVSGIWLSEHGFKIGDRVTITVEENQLTIKPTEPWK